MAGKQKFAFFPSAQQPALFGVTDAAISRSDWPAVPAKYPVFHPAP
jgi:hypothetical protein